LVAGLIVVVVVAGCVVDAADLLDVDVEVVGERPRLLLELEVAVEQLAAVSAARRPTATIRDRRIAPSQHRSGG